MYKGKDWKDSTDFSGCPISLNIKGKAVLGLKIESINSKSITDCRSKTFTELDSGIFNYTHVYQIHFMIAENISYTSVDRSTVKIK